MSYCQSIYGPARQDQIWNCFQSDVCLFGRGFSKPYTDSLNHEITMLGSDRQVPVETLNNLSELSNINDFTAKSIENKRGQIRHFDQTHTFRHLDKTDSGFEIDYMKRHMAPLRDHDLKWLTAVCWALAEQSEAFLLTWKRHRKPLMIYRAVVGVKITDAIYFSRTFPLNHYFCY